MPIYSITFAEDIPNYAHADIEAEDDAAAIEAATSYELCARNLDLDHFFGVNRRIASIENDAGDIIAEDISLEMPIPRSGEGTTCSLCDAIQVLLGALRRIRDDLLNADYVPPSYILDAISDAEDLLLDPLPKS
jgi:hypothetical protein